MSLGKEGTQEGFGILLIDLEGELRRNPMLFEVTNDGVWKV